MTSITVKDGAGADQTVETIDEITARLGALTASKQVDPDAASASLMELQRGLMQLVEDSTITPGDASTPGANYVSVHAKTTDQVFTVVNAPTVSATPDYSVLDVIGGEIVLANAARITGKGGIITGVTIVSKVDLTIGDIDILFFNDNPAGTYTDNGALTVSDADMLLLEGSAIPNIKTVLSGSKVMLEIDNLNIGYKCAATSLYAVPVARAAINLGSTTDLQFTFKLLRD